MIFRSIVGGVAQSAPRPGQTSTSKIVDLRIVGGARRRRAPLVTRHQAKAFWADLMARRAETREDAARIFSITFQCACNWFDGAVVPSGDKVLIAIKLWPEEFGLVDEERVAA